MALVINDFTPIGGQGRSGVGVQLFSYKSVDNLAAIVTAGYFNDLRDQVYVGDVIVVQADTGNTPLLSLVHFAVVPRSPLVTNVTIDAADINAA